MNNFLISDMKENANVNRAFFCAKKDNFCWDKGEAGEQIQ